MARRAGSSHASAATKASSTAAPTSATGSSGCTPKSSPRRSPAGRDRAKAPDRGARDREPQALAEHEPAHVGGRRAEGHADADLGVALAHVRGHHRVEADRCEQQGRKAKDADQEGVEARPRERRCRAAPRRA